MAVSAADDRVAARLRTAELSILGRFATASNATLLCWLCDDGAPPHTGIAEGEIDVTELDPARLCIYKPRRGEAPLWDFPQGTLYRREVAAYEVDRLLGWGLVPLTVVREDGPFGRGAVQRYVSHDPDRHYFWMLEQGPAGLLSQLHRMVLFDVVIDNADRKGGHVLLGADEQVWLVDHGVSFNVQRKLRTVAWQFAGEPVPAGPRADIERLHSLLVAEDDDTATLRSLLAPAEIDRLVARCAAAAAMAVFPQPLGPRPYPWPPL